MKKIFILLLLVILSCNSKKEKEYNFTTVFEKSNGLETATNSHTITFPKAE